MNKSGEPQSPQVVPSALSGLQVAVCQIGIHIKHATAALTFSWEHCYKLRLFFSLNVNKASNLMPGTKKQQSKANEDKQHQPPKQNYSWAKTKETLEKYLNMLAHINKLHMNRTLCIDTTHIQQITSTHAHLKTLVICLNLKQLVFSWQATHYIPRIMTVLS